MEWWNQQQNCIICLSKCPAPYKKKSFIDKENDLNIFSSQHFTNIIKLPEVLSNRPDQHVNDLSQNWSIDE